jgi:hypothetical protein
LNIKRLTVDGESATQVHLVPSQPQSDASPASASARTDDEAQSDGQVQPSLDMEKQPMATPPVEVTVSPEVPQRQAHTPPTLQATDAERLVPEEELHAEQVVLDMELDDGVVLGSPPTNTALGMSLGKARRVLVKAASAAVHTAVEDTELDEVAAFRRRARLPRTPAMPPAMRRAMLQPLPDSVAFERLPLLPRTPAPQPCVVMQTAEVVAPAEEAAAEAAAEVAAAEATQVNAAKAAAKAAGKVTAVGAEWMVQGTKQRDHGLPEDAAVFWPRARLPKTPVGGGQEAADAPTSPSPSPVLHEAQVHSEPTAHMPTEVESPAVQGSAGTGAGWPMRAASRTRSGRTYSPKPAAAMPVRSSPCTPGALLVHAVPAAEEEEESVTTPEVTTGTSTLTVARKALPSAFKPRAKLARTPSSKSSRGVTFAQQDDVAAKISMKEDTQRADRTQDASDAMAWPPVAPVTPLGDVTNQRKASLPEVKTTDRHGVPNKTCKYSEDVPVQLHMTPFEDRVVRALQKSQRTGSLLRPLE